MKTLYLGWRQLERRWGPVGRLRREGREYIFQYTRGALAAQSAGFRSLLTFPDLDMALSRIRKPLATREPRRLRQQFLKAPPGATGTEVIATELLEQFLVPVHDAEAAADLGFGGVSPSSVYWTARKQGRSSESSSYRMAHLLAWARLEPSTSKRAIVPDSAIAVECCGGGCLITGFSGATGTAGIVFLLLAAIVWLALPFGHPARRSASSAVTFGGTVTPGRTCWRRSRHPRPCLDRWRSSARWPRCWRADAARAHRTSSLDSIVPVATGR